MRLTPFYITLFLLSVLYGCQSPIHSSTRAAQAGEVFQISVPSNFQDVKDLHPNAEIQAADEKNGFFILGIRESKDDLKSMRLRYKVEDYAWFVERKLTEGIDTHSVVRLPSPEIAGKPTVRFSFQGLQSNTSGNLHLWMRACIIESETAFYQIVSWTSADQFTILETAMNQVENSFLEFGTDSNDKGKSATGSEGAAI